MRRIFFFCFCLTGIIYSQQTVKLGSYHFSILQKPYCVYHDNSQGYDAYIETYMEIKKDSIYIYEVWYGFENNKKTEVLSVLMEVGALKDIDPAKCALETTEPSEGVCQYALFLEEKYAEEEPFYFKFFEEGIPVEVEATGMMLLFCDDKNVLNEIMPAIKAAQ